MIAFITDNLREYETIQANRIYHAYLFVSLSKKTYKGGAYHNRKSSLCHNPVVRVHWARRSNKLTVRREPPEKVKYDRVATCQKFYREQTLQPILTLNKMLGIVNVKMTMNFSECYIFYILWWRSDDWVRTWRICKVYICRGVAFSVREHLW